MLGDEGEDIDGDGMEEVPGSLMSGCDNQEEGKEDFGERRDAQAQLHCVFCGNRETFGRGRYQDKPKVRNISYVALPNLK